MGVRQEWERLESSPKYQNANDAEREDMRVEFREEQFVARLHPAQQDMARDFFDSKTVRRGDAYSSDLGDAGHLVGSGALEGFADLAQGVTLGNRNSVADWLREAAAGQLESVSPSMLEAVEGFGLEEGDGLQWKEGSTLKGGIGATLQGIGSLAPSMIPGAIAGKGLSIAGRAASGVGKAAKVSEAASDLRSASAAYKRGRQIDAVASSTGYGMTGGAMITGGTANQIYNEHLSVPEPEAMQSDRYRDLLQTSAARYPENPDLARQEARGIWAEEASLQQREKSFALGFASMALGGPIESRLLRGAGQKTRAGGFAKGLGTEATQEAVESGGQQAIVNLAAQQSGLDRDTWEGVKGNAATGVILGAAVGGIMGGLPKPRTPATAEHLRSQLQFAEADTQGLEQAVINVQNADEYQEARQKLAENYQKRFDIEQQLKGKPTTSDVNDADIAVSGVSAAPREQREWVPKDVDDKIDQLRDELSTRGQKLKRTMKNGGKADEVMRGEQSIARMTRELDRMKSAADNRSNQQFFETADEFFDWADRKSRGGNTEASADRELAIRKVKYAGSMAQQMAHNVEKPVPPKYPTLDKVKAANPLAIPAPKVATHQVGRGAMPTLTALPEPPPPPPPRKATKAELERAGAASGRGMMRGDEHAQAKSDYAESASRADEAREASQRDEAEKKRKSALKKEKETKKKKEAKQKEIDQYHPRTNDIGRYYTFPVDDNTFAVSGVSKAESADMNRLGGTYHKSDGLWHFPKASRQKVEDALHTLHQSPQKASKEVPKQKRIYPSTIQKKSRRLQAKKQRPRRGLGMAALSEKEKAIQKELEDRFNRISDRRKTMLKKRGRSRIKQRLQSRIDENSRKIADYESRHGRNPAEAAFIADEATHIHTDPVTGEQAYVVYVGQPFGDDMHVYVDYQDQPHAGRESEFQSLSDYDPRKELEAEQKRIKEEEDRQEKAYHEELRKERQKKIIEEQNRPKPYPEEEATHVYSPKKGDDILVKPASVSEAGGEGWYRNTDGVLMFLGDRKKRIKSLKEIKAEKERQAAQERKEKAKKIADAQAEERAIARQEAARKKRFKNEFLTIQSIGRKHGLIPDKANLQVKGKEGSWYIADINGKRLTDEQLTGYLDDIEEKGFHPYPVQKLEKSNIAKITHKNLQDKPLIGNGKGEAWTRYSDAKLQLQKKGLQDTHYVTEDKGNHWIKKKPDLSDISWGYIAYERNGAIEYLMVPSSVNGSQESYIRDITGERFSDYRNEPDNLTDMNADPVKGQRVLRLTKTNKDHFLKLIEDSNPPPPPPQQEPAPAPKKEETTPPAKKKRLGKHVLTTIAQYNQNEQDMDDLHSGNVDKKYYRYGSDSISGGLTEAGQKKYDKLEEANKTLYSRIKKYAAKNYTNADDWADALEEAGIEPDFWPWDDFDIESITEAEAEAAQKAEAKPESEKEESDGPRGFTIESGAWRGSHYDRIADSRQVPPNPKGMAKFIDALNVGDLFIDKFGNKRGIVGKKQYNHVKLMGFDPKGDPFVETVSFKDYVPKGELQALKAEVDRLSNNGQTTKPEPEPPAPEPDLPPAANKPEARKKRRRKRAGKRIEIDEELSKAGDELAAVFRAEAGKLGSGLDPVLVAKVLQHGMKVGVLYVRKGAIQFADWADSMLEMMESKGIDADDVLPHLKPLYQAVSASDEISDEIADQMDDRKTVRGFDLESLFDEEVDTEEELQPPDPEEVKADADLPADAKPSSLSQALYQHLTADLTFKDNHALKKFVAEYRDIPVSDVTPEMMKDAQEAMEVALVMQARDIINKGQPERETYDELVGQYENQPLLNVRSSTSMENQAYSTPAPLAYLSSQMAGITPQSDVYEPTAGNGMLLIGGDVSKATVNELNNHRADNLESMGYTVTRHDATTFVPKKKHNAMVTNPPFGTMREHGSIKTVRVDGYKITRLEHLIAAKALEVIKDDGKATIIIAADRDEPGKIGEQDRIFLNWLYSHYNVTDHFEVNGDLYKRQGAGWPVRVITVDGRKESNRRSPKSGEVPRLDTWSEIYDRTLDARSGRADEQRTGVSDNQQGGTGSGAATGLSDGSSVEQDNQAHGKSGSGRGGRTGAGSSVDSAGAADSGGAGTSAGHTAGVGTGSNATQQTGVSAEGESRPGNSETGDRAKLDKSVGSTVKPAVKSSEYQTAYTPSSGGFNDAVLTPVNMAMAAEKAMQAIRDQVGNIDQYVMDKLGYDSEEDLYKAFMGLQVDTVGAAIYNADRKNKGIIIADQTGVGKGRQAAGIIRYAHRSGKIPIFITVKDNLFTDMYNDLADIGTTDINPLLMNRDAVIKQMDEKGNELPDLFQNPRIRTVKGEKYDEHAEILENIVKTGKLPEGSQALFLTYSQINKNNLQRKVINALAKNAYFVMDESHNAAGNFHTRIPQSKGGGKRVTTAGFLAEAIKEGNVTYLSATYAKRPDNIPIYFRTDLLDAVDSMDELISAVEAGGVPLQTVMSGMLSEAGQLFRRERSFDGIEIKTVVDYENSKAHKDRYDKVTEGLRAVVDADQMFQHYFLPWAQDNAEELGGKVKAAGNQAAKSVDHNNFTSIAHNYVSQLLMAMKAEGTIQDAIRLHKDDKKPVIATDNTMGSFMVNMVNKYGLKVGDPFEFDYKDVLLYALERSRRLSVKDDKGDTEAIQIEMDELDGITRDAYERAEATINELDIGDLPVSPIDYIRSELTSNGINVSEITGRDYLVDYSGDVPVLGKRDSAEKKDKRATVDKFNTGKLDALVINQSGATGLSIHSSSRFADQNPRHMIVMQASLDINIMMQMLGRINRTGQVAPPEYTIKALDLPAEKRPTAVLSGKMKSLNANTSANSDSDTSIDVPNILNKYGNKVVAAYLRENPSLARSLGITITKEEKEPPSDLAKKFTGRISFKTNDIQQAAYDVIEPAYNDLIDFLDKTNQNDLNPQTLDLDARIVDSEVIYQGKDPTTIFGGNTTLHKVDSRYQGKPPKPDEVGRAIDKGLDGKSPEDVASDLFEGKVAAAEKYLQEQTDRQNALDKKWREELEKDELTEFGKAPSGMNDVSLVVSELKKHDDYGEGHQLTKKYEGFESRLEGYLEAEQQFEFSKRTTERLLKNPFKVGTHVKLDLGDEDVTGVVTSVKDAHKDTGNPFSLSKTRVTFMVNSGVRQITLPLTQLDDDSTIYDKMLNTRGKQALDNIFEPFADTGERRETRYIATGNLIAGSAELRKNQGRIVSFTGNDKQTYQGILLPKKYKQATSAKDIKPVPLRDVDKALKFVRANKEDRMIAEFGIRSKNDQVALRSAGNQWRIVIPKSNKDKIVKDVKFDPELRTLIGDFYSRGSLMTAEFGNSKLPAVMKRLFELTPMTALGTMDAQLEAVGISTQPEAVNSFDARAVAQASSPDSRYALVPEGEKAKGLKSYEKNNLHKHLQRAFGKMAVIKQHESELPAHLREQIAADGASGRVKGLYDPRTDQVYLIAGHIDSIQDGAEIFAHEAIGHKGVRAVLGSAMNRTLDQIYDSLTDAQTRRLRREYANQIAGRSQEEQRRIIAEEYLAHLAEVNPQNNWVQDMVARIRRWVRNYIPILKWSDADVRQLLIDAGQKLKDDQNAQSETAPVEKQDTPDSARYKLSIFGNNDTRNAKEQIGMSYGSLKEAVRAKSLGWLGGRQIADLYSRVFDKLGTNPLQIINDLTQQLSALRNKWANAADEIDRLWSKLAANKTVYQNLSTVMHRSTLAKVDPRWAAYQHKHGTLDSLNEQLDKATSDKQTLYIMEMIAEEKQRMQDYKRLRELYNKGLNDDARALFDQVEKYYKDQWQAQKVALKERADALELDANTASKLKKEMDVLFHRDIKDGPYFPLMRFGKFAIVGKTPEGKPFRQHYESLKDLQMAKKELPKTGYTIDSSGKVKEMEASEMGGVTQFTGKIFKSVEEGKMKDLDPKIKDAFMDEINQIALSMLPELSAAKRGMHRKGIAGYDENARRAFATTSLHGANRLGRIKFGWRIEDQLKAMDKVTDAARKSPLDPDDKIMGRAVAHEMRKRHDLNMNPNGSPLASHITNAAFIWYLGGSVGAGLVNMTQNILVALPQLGSRYGFTRTSMYMARASKDYFRYGKQKLEGMDGVLRESWFDLSKMTPNKHITQDEINMLKELVEDGTIDTTQAHTLAQIAGSDIRPEEQKTRDWYTKLTRGSGLFFHNAEVANRQIAALTAYRLYRDNAKPGTFDDAKARKFTRDAVFDAHFDYSSFNRPRHMKGNWAKVFMIFKQHSQNMSYNLAKTFYSGLVNKADRKTEKGAQARRALFGTLGLHAMFAGVMGLPGVSMLLGAIEAFDDDDEPLDARAEIRRVFADWFGETHGHALAKGVFNGYLNLDLHARTSLDELWVRSPGYDMPARQEAMHYVTSVFGGPAVGQLINMRVGLSEVADGNMTGLQKMVPKFMRDMMKTAEYTRHGLVDRNGIPVVDQVAPGEKFWTALGIGSGRVSEAYDAKSAVKTAQDSVNKRKSQLLGQLDRAIWREDDALRQRTEKNIERFNKIYQARGRDWAWAVITRERKKNFLKNRRKARAEADNGIILPATRQGMKQYAEPYAL